MLTSIAGDDSHHELDRQAAACAAELRPVIQRLMQDGRQPSAIIAALAQLTVYAVEQQRPH